MSWLQKGIKAWNKAMGQELSEDASEAEFVDAMESATPLSEAIENSETLETLNSRISALETANKTFVTQETLDTTLATSVKKVEDVVSANTTNIQNNANLIESNKTAVSKEINDMKTKSSTTGTPATPQPGVKTEVLEEDEDNMVVNSKELFGSTNSVVPGLF